MDRNKKERTVDWAGILMRALTVVVIIAALSLVPVFSWLAMQRSAAAMASISNPMALYIDAGHEEDMRYLNLSGINVEAGTYKDYVFCISGTNIMHYKMQLAYTTNNQLTFTIFQADEFNGVGDPPAGAVEYKNHPTSGDPETFYYTKRSETPVAGNYLNKKPGEEILALTTGDPASTVVDGTTYVNEHSATYDTYNYVQKYAEPIYWQSAEQDGDVDDFCNYYILRVSWAANKRNDKETDIIYISAKSTN